MVLKRKKSNQENKHVKNNNKKIKMAIIYTYPAIGTPEDSDIMLISDVSLPNNATRNITLSNLATFIHAKVD